MKIRCDYVTRFLTVFCACNHGGHGRASSGVCVVHFPGATVAEASKEGEWITEQSENRVESADDRPDCPLLRVPRSLKPALRPTSLRTTKWGAERLPTLVLSALQWFFGPLMCPPGRRNTQRQIDGPVVATVPAQTRLLAYAYPTSLRTTKWGAERPPTLVLSDL